MKPLQFKDKLSKLIEHQTKVQVAASLKYGIYSLECWLAAYHDFVEDGFMTLDEAVKDMVSESEDLSLADFTAEEFKTALDAISRRKTETYFDYIRRLSLNKAAARVKVLDLKENRFKRGSCPETLKKRYDKALSMLAELGYN